MSCDNQEASSEILSDDQRLATLEKDRRLERIILLAVVALLVMILASWLTWALMNLFAEEPEAFDSSQLDALQKQQLSLESQLASLKQELSRLEAQSSSTPPPSAPSSDKRESLQQLAGMLIAQEQGFQHSLAALKSGKRDLAGMIAGSRSWLGDYNEALDKELAESQARIEHLQLWATGKGTAIASPPP